MPVSPDTLTDLQIDEWEQARDQYGPAAVFARMTQGGVWKAHNLLWNAGWFRRAWCHHRDLLCPLVLFQRLGALRSEATASEGGTLAAPSSFLDSRGESSPRRGKGICQARARRPHFAAANRG